MVNSFAVTVLRVFFHLDIHGALFALGFTVIITTTTATIFLYNGDVSRCVIYVIIVERQALLL